MRKKLKELGSEERHTFSAIYERTGVKRGYKGRIEQTILLLNVKLVEGDQEKPICDHIWFTKYKGWHSLQLKKGDKIYFDGRMASYEKGHRGYIDYKIEFPTRFRKIPIADRTSYEYKDGCLNIVKEND